MKYLLQLGKNVIPILSGHIGGANKLSEIIADEIDADANITTATDINGVWSVDSWATNNGMTIKNAKYIKKVSSKVLNGDEINVESCIKIDGLPEQIKVNVSADKLDAADNADVLVTYKNIEHDTLVLIPKVLSVGIGCKKDTPMKDIQSLWDKVCNTYNLDSNAVKQINSIDIKANEAGLIEFASANGYELHTFSADELNSLEGRYSTSEFVKSIAGVDCVCERSAVMGADEKDDSCIIVRKTAENGVTIAVALKGRL